MSDFVAAINAKGQTLSGWESVTIKRSFHDSISTFEFSTTEKVGSSIQLQPGDPVTITLNGQQVINGKVTTRSVALDANSHQIIIAGKCKVADVMESSVPVKPGDLSGSTLAQVAQMVAQPHGVGVVVRNGSSSLSNPFQSLAIQYGETGSALLWRLALHRGCFLSDDANGNLVVGQGNPNAGPIADLVEGQNILSIVGLLDDQTAFSQYTFASQMPDASASQPQRWQSSTSTNPNATSNRVKLSIAEHPVDSTGLNARTGVEASISQWPTVQLTVKVPGWFRPDGSLWQPTDNVSVVSPSVFPTQGGKSPTLGIQTVVWQQNSQEGSTTTLTLILPWLMTDTPLYNVPDATAPASSSSSSSTTSSSGTAATPNSPDYNGGTLGPSTAPSPSNGVNDGGQGGFDSGSGSGVGEGNNPEIEGAPIILPEVVIKKNGG